MVRERLRDDDPCVVVIGNMGESHAQNQPSAQQLQKSKTEAIAQALDHRRRRSLRFRLRIHDGFVISSASFPRSAKGLEASTGESLTDGIAGKRKA
jgi:hypothetical protein